MENMTKDEVNSILQENLTAFKEDIRSMVTEVAKTAVENNSFHHSINSSLGWGLLSGVIVFLLLILLLKNNKFFKECVGHRKNQFWISVWAISCSIFIWSLYCLGSIKPPTKEGFWDSEVDIFLAVISIIAVIGAVWAVLARIDAEKAFNKSQETLDALGNTFEFSEILNDDKLVEIIDSIGNEHTRINLFLGFPCIGYLYQGKKDFKIKPEELFERLNRKLTDLLDQIQNKTVKTKFHLNIATLSFDDAKELLTDDAGNYKPINFAKEDCLLKFYNLIQELDNDEAKKYVKHIKIVKNENLRFSSIRQENKSTSKSKAIIWVVSNLSGVKPFDSAGFQSSDTKLISVLEAVFNGS